jgi:hypothetical protein
VWVQALHGHALPGFQVIRRVDAAEAALAQQRHDAVAVPEHVADGAL